MLVCDGFSDKAKPWSFKDSLIIATLRIAFSEDYAGEIAWADCSVPPDEQSPCPIIIDQSVFFRLRAVTDGVEIFSLQSELQLTHCPRLSGLGERKIG